MQDEIQTKLGELRTLRDEWAADQAELGRYATDIGNAFMARFAELDELLTVAADTIEAHRDGDTAIALNGAAPGGGAVDRLTGHRQPPHGNENVMSTTGAAPDPDEAAEHVIGPAAANRHRSVYRVVERRGEQLLLRLVGVLLRPGVVQRRDQVLPGATWMSAEPFAPFDMTSAAQVEPEILFSQVPEGTQWQVLACQETSTYHLITVDHDDLNVEHDPHDCTALADAIRARALHLLADGAATEIGVERPPVEITNWARHGSAAATQALTHVQHRINGID